MAIDRITIKSQWFCNFKCIQKYNSFDCWLAADTHAHTQKEKGNTRHTDLMLMIIIHLHINSINLQYKISNEEKNELPALRLD